MVRGTVRPLPMQPDVPRAAPHRLLRRRRVRQGRRTAPRHPRADLRASLAQRRLELPRDRRPDAGREPEGRRPRLVRVGHAEDADNYRLGRPAALRPPRSGHDIDHRRRAQPHHPRRRLLVPAPGHGLDGAAASTSRTSTTRTSRRPRRRAPLGRARADQFLTGAARDEPATRSGHESETCRPGSALAIAAGCSGGRAGVDRRRPAPAATGRLTDQRRRAPPSRTRSTRSGSPSTTSCTPTCASTTSRSARAAASGRSRADGVLRRLGPADDRRAAAGRTGQDPALPHRARRRRTGLQPARVSRAAEVHRPAARRHLPRQGRRSGTIRRSRR